MKHENLPFKIACLYDGLEPIEKLKSHPKNRNRHPKEQIERFAKILKANRVRRPVRISKLSGFVTSGHGQIEAFKLNGWSHVPVNYQDYESEAEEIADLNADNALALWADLDFAEISNDMVDLGPDFDIDLLGIQGFMLDKNFDPGNIDDQGKLDQKELVFMECPNCGKEFEKSQAKIKN